MSQRKVIRCSSCSKKIAEGYLNDGLISIKCKCGALTTLEVHPKVEEKAEIKTDRTLETFTGAKMSR